MGHKRLGRLPRRHRWNEVVGLLEQPQPSVASVASATADAAQDRLRELARDPSLTYSFWLLARLASASTRTDFATALSELGFAVTDQTSSLAFVTQVSDRVRREVARYPESGPYAELASLALTTALNETVAATTPSLFGSSLLDLQSAVRTYASRERFGDLAQRFFGSFLARTLTYLVDREVPNHVGSGRGLPDVGAAAAFLDALDVHARESAVIVKDFAGGWRSKRDWETRGEITEADAQRFVAVALRKLRAELALRDA